MESHGSSFVICCAFTISYHFPPLFAIFKASFRILLHGLVTLVFTSARSLTPFLLLGAKEQAVRRASARQKTKEREALRALWAVWTSVSTCSTLNHLETVHWFHCHLTDFDVSLFWLFRVELGLLFCCRGLSMRICLRWTGSICQIWPWQRPASESDRGQLLAEKSFDNLAGPCGFAVQEPWQNTVCSQVIAYAKKELSVNVDKVLSCFRATKLQQGSSESSEALTLPFASSASSASSASCQVLLDKIWRCTVDEDEKGISFEKPLPYFSPAKT